MDSAHKNLMEKTYEVLLIKNAYHIVFQGEFSIFGPDYNDSTGKQDGTVVRSH